MRLVILFGLSALVNSHPTGSLIGSTLKLEHDSLNGNKELPIGSQARHTRNIGKRKSEIYSLNGNKELPIGSQARHTRNIGKRKSEIYCSKYLESTCDNSTQPLEPRVWERVRPGGLYFAVGGVQALGKSHPHMALIGYGEKKEWLCGGSLISEKFVLSAAHCAVQGILGPAQWARLGELDYSTDKDDASPQDRKIVKRILHPEYKEPPLYHDIALFLLDRPVEFTPWVKPICLHTGNRIPFEKVNAAGWGRTGYVEGLSTHLVEIQISLVPIEECKTQLGARSRIPTGVDSRSMVCAGEKLGGVDTCSGDSGGPLLMKWSGRCLWTQIGITSFGEQCALPDSPGIYTKVSNYLPWIENIVWP